jgi:hypothetical protein
MIKRLNEESAAHNLIGSLVWAGNLTVNDEKMTGVAVSISPENLAGKPLPMYQEVAIVPAARLAGNGLADMLVNAGVIDHAALDDPEGYDRGVTLSRLRQVSEILMNGQTKSTHDSKDL